MLYTERKTEILKHLELKSVVKVSDLVRDIGVSTDTIRRDLKAMEKEGLLRCIRGGACLSDKIEMFSNFAGREIINIELKREAAKKAVKYINENDVIFLNSGTTNTILAQEIAERAPQCTIVTNNIAVVSVIMAHPNIKVVVLGGNLDNLEKSVYGSVCEKELSTFCFDVSFLSVNSVNTEMGYTDFRFNEIPIMQAAVKCSKKVVTVMDSSKFGRAAKKRIFGLEETDLLVTDNSDIQEEKKKLIEAGLNIV
ncbi:MAG: DeoR/GlpR family DNA-binding transcription regulator [Clostridia bacterium]|nr:DeoR/GlpR family DNA-binding transcription regulator [Clostridia bacterium]